MYRVAVKLLAEASVISAQLGTKGLSSLTWLPTGSSLPWPSSSGCLSVLTTCSWWSGRRESENPRQKPQSDQPILKERGYIRMESQPPGTRGRLRGCLPCTAHTQFCILPSSVFINLNVLFCYMFFIKKMFLKIMKATFNPPPCWKQYSYKKFQMCKWYICKTFFLCFPISWRTQRYPQLSFINLLRNFTYIYTQYCAFSTVHLMFLIYLGAFFISPCKDLGHSF